MPIKSFDHQLGKAVIDLVQTGAYPESEHVVAAELSPSTLPVASRLIQEAVEDVKVIGYAPIAHETAALLMLRLVVSYQLTEQEKCF